MASTRQRLVNDWRFKYPGDPDACDGWSYDWDYAECSTSQPTPRDGCATLILIVNHSNSPVADFQDFIAHASRAARSRGEPKLNLQFQGQEASRKRFVIKQGDLLELKGDVTASGDAAIDGDPNIAFYARVDSTTLPGELLLHILAASARHGYAAVIEHSQVTLDVDPDQELKLTTVTGYGPDEDGFASSKGLATRFVLSKSGVDVARCHLSYRDGSWDPSFGPTIEQLTVHRDYRGQKYLLVLWYWVRCFIEDNITLECFNNDAEPGHVMIKATQLTNAEVDQYDGRAISDKEFFYDYAGFSVRVQKGFGALMAGPGRRPVDEEAVLYIPLMSQQELQNRTTFLGPDNIHWKPNRGACPCEACGRIMVGTERCGRCLMVHYCNRECQRKDWKYHKIWCGKTKDEFRDKLVEMNLLKRGADGETIIMAGGPMGF